MSKIRYTLKDGSVLEIETETPQEFRECFREIISQENGQQISEIKKNTATVLTDEEIEEKLPRNGEIEKYILSKPNFRYSIAELTEKFFGVRMKVKDNDALYNRLYKRTKLAEDKIAREHKGEWKRIRKGSRSSLKVEHVFKPSQIN